MDVDDQATSEEEDHGTDDPAVTTAISNMVPIRILTSQAVQDQVCNASLTL